MSKLQFLNSEGDFFLEDAHLSPDIYFPLVNESPFISSITPYLAGDCKVDQNTFLLEPASEETLIRRNTSRNFWIRVDGLAPWSATGCSAQQLANHGTPKEERADLYGGLLWQRVERTWEEAHISCSILNFVPADDVKAEIMQVSLTNHHIEPVTMQCIAAIPIYGRSADHIRDHRHVTSLLHRGKVTAYGLDVTPTLTFDERGHLPGNITYRVWGADDQGMPPQYLVPLTREFLGSGTPLWPECIQNLPPDCCRHRESGEIEGGEMTASLYFEPRTLLPGESVTYQIVLAIDSDPSCYLTPSSVASALQRTKEYWQQQTACVIQTGDPDLTAWLRWVSIQPTLRRICGCSFLPHHDYGRGGRGWRDLWQDSLALLLRNPYHIRADLLSHFGGVRLDGTNATIIGSTPGEFKADRNNIPRVWMDHGYWPFVTTHLYLQETGDLDFLLESCPYFNDCFAFRGEWDRPKTSATRNGTVLEHLLIQQITAFFDVGTHGNIRLRGADWNDGLDMAVQNGESVAFTAAYGGSLRQLAEVLSHMSCNTLRLSRPLIHLLQQDFGQPENMQQALRHYCAEAYTDFSQEEVETDFLASRLLQMSSWIFDRIRQEEYVGDEGSLMWFNSYYDNHSRKVEGVFENTVRMMLTGQVFTIMSGAALEEQVTMISRAVNWYLWDYRRGGCFLNTDFHEVKTDLGRMFGFAYGSKENGAVFSHMAVMYAFALYSRGFVSEGLRVLDGLYQQSLHFEKGHILPGIPEYFDIQGRGMYPYLTGAASWLLLTLTKQIFGIEGEWGYLNLNPKLQPEQFDTHGNACISCFFAGQPIDVIYSNPKFLPYGSYRVVSVFAGEEPVALPISQEKLATMPKRIVVNLG